MFSDTRTVLWLKMRHVRTDLIRWLYFAGTDFREDTDLHDRLYQLYFIGIVGVFLALSWSALVNQIEVVSATLSPSLTPLFSYTYLYALAMLFFLSVLSHLRSVPLKLSLPDISYLAASSIRTGALMTTEACLHSLGTLVMGFLGGYLCGTSLSMFSDIGISVWTLACLTGLLLFSLSICAWLMGIVQYSVDKRFRMRTRIAAYIALPCIALSVLLIIAFSPASPDILASITSGNAPLMLLVTLVLLASALLVLARLSRSIDMTAIIDANWLVAELYPLRGLQYQDPQRYIEIKREKKLALRGPRLSLPKKSGPVLLIARAALTHARRFESLPGLMVWCMALIPSGAALMLTASDPTFMFLWLIAALAYEGAAGAATAVFKTDLGNRMIRDHLPYSTFALLLLDSLPVLLTMLFLAIVSSAVLCVALQIDAASIALSALLVLGLVLCGGVSSVKPSYAKKPLSFEAGLFIMLVPVCLIVFSGSMTVSLLAELAILLVYIFSIRSSPEL